MQTSDSPIQETQNPTYDFHTLDQIVRKWAVQSSFEQDLEKYEQLQQEYR
jgi:hypothetical protein